MQQNCPIGNYRRKLRPIPSRLSVRTVVRTRSYERANRRLRAKPQIGTDSRFDETRSTGEWRLAPEAPSHQYAVTGVADQAHPLRRRHTDAIRPQHLPHAGSHCSGLGWLLPSMPSRMKPESMRRNTPIRCDGKVFHVLTDHDKTGMLDAPSVDCSMVLVENQPILVHAGSRLIRNVP
jgi:hypothetical protein